MNDRNCMILIAVIAAVVASGVVLALGVVTPDQWWYAVTRAAPWLAGLL